MASIAFSSDMTTTGAKRKLTYSTQHCVVQNVEEEEERNIGFHLPEIFLSRSFTYTESRWMDKILYYIIDKASNE